MMDDMGRPNIQRFSRAIGAVWFALWIVLSPYAIAEEITNATAPPVIQAKAAVLLDRRTGRVLYALNENAMLPNASTTKVMTALLALENCSLKEIVTTSTRASGVPGTSIYLGIDEQLTMEQMLQAILLRSANDAAVAIAEHIDGSVEAFAERMNARAKELNADAHFVNPNGLDEAGHAVSALGLARIACKALENETFRRIAVTHRVVLPWRDSQYDRLLTNKNKLLTTFKGATGVKTGFTNKAGRCLVFSAEREGMEVVGVVLNCGAWFDSAAQLMEWGFEQYKPQVVLESGGIVMEIPVINGEAGCVCAVAEHALTVPVASGETVQLFVDVPDQLSAPVRRAEDVGRAWVEIDGVLIAETQLVAEETVSVWGYFPALRKIARNWTMHLTN